MLNDPTIVPLTIVLLILVTIAVVQNLYKVVGFLLFTYALYMVIIWIRAETPDTAVFNLQSSVKINSIQDVKVDTTESITQFVRTTSDNSDTHEIIPSSVEKKVLVPLTVNRIVAAGDIVNRLPEQIGSVFADTLNAIYCFTAIRNLNGSPQKLYHRWYYENQYFSTVDIIVGRSYNWRCWSKISNVSEWTGNWEVQVLDSSLAVLDSINFIVRKSFPDTIRRVQ